MVEQLALGAPLRALARATDPATSHAAAAKLDPKHLISRIRVCLWMHPAGLTTHELKDLLQVELVSVSPRMKPLEQAGLVVRDGKRAGRTVWKAP